MLLNRVALSRVFRGNKSCVAERHSSSRGRGACRGASASERRSLYRGVSVRADSSGQAAQDDIKQDDCSAEEKRLLNNVAFVLCNTQARLAMDPAHPPYYYPGHASTRRGPPPLPLRRAQTFRGVSHLEHIGAPPSPLAGSSERRRRRPRVPELRPRRPQAGARAAARVSLRCLQLVKGVCVGQRVWQL